MVRSAIPSSNGTLLKFLSPTLSHACEMDAEPTVKARRLRDLAAWYRACAERTANPAIWEARMLVADHLEAEASRIDPNRMRTERSSRAKETSDEAK